MITSVEFKLLGIPIFSNKDDGGLSEVDINNFIWVMATSTSAKMENEEGMHLELKPDANYLESFCRIQWNKIKKSDVTERIPTFKIVLNEGYHLSFYEDDYLAMIYSEGSEEKYALIMSSNRQCQ